jgi:hypothetical protein
LSVHPLVRNGNGFVFSSPSWPASLATHFARRSAGPECTSSTASKCRCRVRRNPFVVRADRMGLFCFNKTHAPIPESEWVRFFGSIFFRVRLFFQPILDRFPGGPLSRGIVGADPSGTVRPHPDFSATEVKRGVCVAWFVGEFIGGLEIAGIEFGAIRFVCSTYGRMGLFCNFGFLGPLRRLGIGMGSFFRVNNASRQPCERGSGGG